MKVYRGKAIVVGCSDDDMFLSFWDPSEGQNVSILIPCELIPVAKCVSVHRATTVLIDRDMGLVGMNLSEDDDELVDE